VIYMYARVRMQSLTLIDQVVVEIFEVVERWVAGDVWVRVSSTYINSCYSRGQPKSTNLISWEGINILEI
jgi:hypothetical protein